MSSERISFRWKHIWLPAAILLLSLALAAYFYRLLPAELVYSFKSGAAENSMSRIEAIIWTVAPQVALVLLAAGIVWLVTWLGRRAPGAASPVTEKIMSLMGNMLALPQVILAFAMLDIFIYNLYQTHIMPLLAFALIVMAAGLFILVAYFLVAVRQLWRASGTGFKEQ